MLFSEPRRTAIALCCAAQLVLCVSALALDGIPDKDTWKLRNGGTFRGHAHDFGYQLCLLQRRMGKVYVNGAEVKNAGTKALLERLAEHYSVPLDDPKALQLHLAQQPYAQVRLEMMAEELAIQQSIEQAEWNQAYEMQQQGQTLRDIERNLRKR